VARSRSAAAALVAGALALALVTPGARAQQTFQLCVATTSASPTGQPFKSCVPVDSSAPLPTTTGFSATPTSAVTRPANTTTYTTNTGWNTATSGSTTVFSFTSACRINGGEVLIPEIDIWSSANPSTKLQGILWLFAGVPGTVVQDDATFNIAAADFANLTGNQQGFPFTLASAQASGAANSGVSLSGTTYHAQCASGTTTISGMVQVVNAYVPASGEVLHVTLHTIGVN
jgi:hypothetical protein